ncbi:MAG: biotin synthase BioB [Thermoguttaceae bacterium]
MIKSEHNEIIDFVKSASLDRIFSVTTQLREKQFGKNIETCMIVNAKCGLCVNDCKFCAQSSHYVTEVSSFPLISKDDLLKSYRRAEAAKSHHWGIVTSGQAVSKDELSEITNFISDNLSDGNTRKCASLGQLNRDSLNELKQAGLTRYHHNLEVSQNFYPQICSTQKWEDRARTVRLAKEVGLEVCSGGLFGLGESWENRAELAASLNDLGVTCVPINFFDANPAVPLARLKQLSADEALRIVALFRMILPTVSIRICGGRPKILQTMQHHIFDAGADALMTGDYLTTTGVTPESDHAMIAAQNCILAGT